MNNLKEIKTTILGAIFIKLSLVYMVYPYFSSRELWEVNNLYFVGGLVAGVLLLLAPDRFLDFLFGWIKKKSE